MERCSGRAHQAVNQESSTKAFAAGIIIDGLLDILISVMKIPAPFALLALHFKIMNEVAQVDWHSQGLFVLRAIHGQKVGKTAPIDVVHVFE